MSKTHSQLGRGQQLPEACTQMIARNFFLVAGCCFIYADSDACLHRMNCMLGASVILVVNLVANGSAKESGGVSALQRDQRRAYWWPLPRSLATSNWIDMDRHWVQVSKRRMAGDHKPCHPKACGPLRWVFMCRRCPLW